MKAFKDKVLEHVVCSFNDDEVKSLRSMLNMIKSSSNRLTDDLNRYSFDFTKFTIKDLATYTTMINTIVTSSLQIAELFSEAEYLTAFELNKKEDKPCHLER